ncbi:hypothetical protein [Microbacterium sp. No. 7]|uniref:hypothetical protein n=1 Tax=Microbacterium sp. No. 7 TaxID=1714373 RepID=UPI0006D1C696|nr:hypothetical protein [Microbacterium sp. No. 7]ALJ21213.1 hypothetical protein AOA12_15410 [Microbacterium sp. No. 7]
MSIDDPARDRPTDPDTGLPQEPPLDDPADDDPAGNGPAEEAPPDDDPAAENAPADDGPTADAPRRVDEAPDALSGEQERRLPSMPRRDAGEVETIAGILVQTRDDTAMAPRDRLVRVLAERLADAGVEVSGDEVGELADQIATGDAGAADG